MSLARKESFPKLLGAAKIATLLEPLLIALSALLPIVNVSAGQSGREERRRPEGAPA